MYVVPRNYEPLSEMIRSFYQKDIALGSGKRAADALDNRQQGRRTATSECIAALLTVMRVSQYPMLAPVPAVDSWNVEKTLKEFLERVNSANGKDRSAVLEEAYQAVVDLVRTEGLDAANAHARRQRIEKGEADLMTEEDAKYFAEKAESIKASAQDYERLAKIPYLTKDGVTEV
jgi:hypothetical protein